MTETLAVAVAGLGSIGMRVARALDAGLPGFRLSAVASRSVTSAAARVNGFASPPRAVALEALAEGADIVVECLPPSAFRALAEPVLSSGVSCLVVASAGALIAAEDIVGRAAAAGVRIVVPSGAVSGLDGLRAAREIGLESVRLVTRKPPRSFGTHVSVDGREVATAALAQPVRVFAGSARESVRAFPKNINVAATISLAGLGPDSTGVEIWADPGISENRHEVHVRSLGGVMTCMSVNLPDASNPRSSAITAFSVLAALRRLNEPLSIGS